jgi:23S rRNA pseudouridine955/2504/2580 synthase
MPVTHHKIIDRAGQRLDNFLLGKLKGVPKSRVYAMVRKGEVRVNGARVRPSVRLASGDVVRIPPYRASRSIVGTLSHSSPGRVDRVAALLRAARLYEDDHLIVINKPIGIAVHGGSGISLGVIEALRAEHPGGNFELIHRLDRDTSGCLAIAKDRRTLLAQHRLFREGGVKKVYDLIVQGCWPKRLRTVRDRLERYVLPNGERRMRVRYDGVAARTDFEIIDSSNIISWVRAFPRTGRTHQIRVHSAARGHAILGDQKYADRAVAHGDVHRLMLHASSLTLSLDGIRRRFDAPLDDAFQRIWETLAV